MLGEEFPIPIKITQRQLADALHVPYQRINELVNQERGVTPSKALRLGRCFGSSPDFWLNLQVKWDLYKARQSESDALADIKDYQHFRKKGTGVELLFRLFTILTKLIEPGSSRAVIAENLLMKQQLIIHSRTRQRAGA